MTDCATSSQKTFDGPVEGLDSVGPSDWTGRFLSLQVNLPDVVKKNSALCTVFMDLKFNLRHQNHVVNMFIIAVNIGVSRDLLCFGVST